MMMSNLFSVGTGQVQVPVCSNPIMTLHIIILGILWLFREMLKDFVFTLLSEYSKNLTFTESARYNI